MVEKLRFEGIDREIEVDFNKAHSEHEAAVYALDEHRPVVSMKSDDGIAVSEVLAKLGEHRFSCSESLRIERGAKGY